MSAGRFKNTKYELDAGNGGGIVGIRVQPETEQATINGTGNAPPADPVDTPGSARVSKTRREFGIGARKVVLKWTGALPTDYAGETVTIPVLTPAAYANWGIGNTGTYLGLPVVVVGRIAESVR